MGVYSKSQFSGEKSSGSIRRKEKEAGNFPAGGFTMKASRKRVPWLEIAGERGKPEKVLTEQAERERRYLG